VGRAARLLIRSAQYSDAVSALNEEIELFAQSDEAGHGMIQKLAMGVVMCQLMLGDSVAANLAFQKCLQYPGVDGSEEAGAIQALLQAWEDQDPETAERALRNPNFRHMDVDFVRLAGKVKVPGGGRPRQRDAGVSEDLAVEEDDDNDLL